MTERGILSAGAYAPRERIAAEEFEEAWGRFDAAEIEEKAVPSPDEDAVTMAYEAASRALAAADIEGDDLRQVLFATTRPPTAEEDPTIHLGEMFGVPNDAQLQLYSGSTRAGTQALLDAVSVANRDGPGLVVVSDCPRGDPETTIEFAAGAGAAAFVVGTSPAAIVREHGRTSDLYQGTRFRRTGDDTTESLDITMYERKAFTETIATAVGELDTELDAIDVAAIQAPDGAFPYKVGRRLGIDASGIQRCILVHELGDTGAASVPLGLTHALADEENNMILGVSFGSGASADALLVDVIGDVPVREGLDAKYSITYAEYLRRRGELTSGPPAGGGAYISVPAWRRTIPQRYRLSAGECPNCDALNFPPAGACSQCHELVRYSPVTLDETGKVEAVTVISQGGAPPEFAEQQAQAGDFAVVIVALDGPDGRTASIPAQIINTDPRDVAVGDRVRVTMRQIYTQEGVTRYGFKVCPVD